MKISMLVDYLQSTQKQYGNLTVKSVKYKFDYQGNLIKSSFNVKDNTGKVTFHPASIGNTENQIKVNYTRLYQLKTLIGNLRFEFDSPQIYNLLGRHGETMNMTIKEIENILQKLEEL